MAMNFGVKKALGITESIRDTHDRNGKAVDAELRSAFRPPPPLNQLSEEQTRAAKSCLGLETASATLEWTSLKSSSPFVALSMQYTKPVGNEPRCARREREAWPYV
jgi:hypothetical protein